MKSKLFASVFLGVASLSQLLATPTSLFWTPCTTDVLARDVWNLDVDNYFTVASHGKHKGSFAPKVGVTNGIFGRNDFNFEVGADFLGGKTNPLLFNGKVGIEENKLFDRCPSISLGLYDVGTTNHRNKQIFNGVLGLRLPNDCGRVFLGGYSGRHTLGKDTSGVMLGYQRALKTVKDSAGKEYNSWELRADYASGKNSIGGGGAAIAYFFAPNVNVITGPVFFNDTHRLGSWKWSLQININSI